MTLPKISVPYLLAVSSLTISAISVVFVMWSVLSPPLHFRLNTTVIKVLTPEVHAGHAALFLVDYCKDNQDVAAVGSYIARRGVVFPLGVWSSDLPLGCHRVAVGVQIPEYIPASTYVLYLTREYRPTIFSTQGYSFSTEPFRVLPADGSPPPLLPIPPAYDDPAYDPPPSPNYTR